MDYFIKRSWTDKEVDANIKSTHVFEAHGELLPFRMNFLQSMDECATHDPGLGVQKQRVNANMI